MSSDSRPSSNSLSMVGLERTLHVTHWFPYCDPPPPLLASIPATDRSPPNVTCFQVYPLSIYPTGRWTRFEIKVHHSISNILFMFCGRQGKVYTLQLVLKGPPPSCPCASPALSHSAFQHVSYVPTLRHNTSFVKTLGVSCM